MINSKKDDLKFLLNPIKSKKFFLIFFILIIIVLAILESSIVGSILPIIDLLSDKDNILKYNRLLNEIFSLELDFEIFIKILLPLIALTFIVIGFLQLLSYYLSALLRESVNKIWRKRIMNSFMSPKNIRFALDNNIGDLSQKLLVHTSNAAHIYWFILLFIRDSFISIFIYSLILIISFKITIYLTVFFIFIVALNFIIAKYIVVKFTNSRNEFQSRLFSLANTILSSLKIIKIFKKDQIFKKKFEHQLKGFESKEILVHSMTNIPAIFIRSISYFSIVMIIFFFLLRDVSFTDLSLFAVYIVGAYKLLNAFGSINNYFLAISSLYPSLKIIRTEIEKINVDYKHQLDDENNDQEQIYNFREKLKIQNISYFHKDKKILENVEIDFNKGSLIAVIGPSGVGKTTFFDILSGFKISKNLKVLKDGVEIFKPKFDQLSYCSQEAFIFRGSLEENITLFEKKDKINNQKLDEVYNACFLKKFINLQDHLFEKGENLSQGQKQRINLARSLYQDYEIIFLDEPLSNVETSLESLIFKNVSNIIKRDNKTLLMITHSLNTLKSVDKIVVLENAHYSSYSSYNEAIKDNDYLQYNLKSYKNE